MRRAAEDAIQAYGYVDVLVNNAGSNLTGYGPVEEARYVLQFTPFYILLKLHLRSMKDVRQAFQSNLFGTLAFTQPLIAHFRTRRTGHIFNVSSVAAGLFPPGWGGYNASKAALDAYTDTLAKEVALFGVKVFILMPGYFPTKIFRTHPAYVEDGKAAPKTPTTAYTDRETQGYDSMNWLPRQSEAMGLIGDPEKLAARVYEIVTGVGMAAQVMERYAQTGWIRVLCGTDCGQIVLKKTEDTVANIKAYESIWKSTDIDSTKPLYLARL